MWTRYLTYWPCIIVSPLSLVPSSLFSPMCICQTDISMCLKRRTASLHALFILTIYTFFVYRRFHRVLCTSYSRPRQQTTRPTVVGFNRTLFALVLQYLHPNLTLGSRPISPVYILPQFFSCLVFHSTLPLFAINEVVAGGERNLWKASNSRFLR